MSFTQHLLKLMTSWAVVADVYFLEPQRRLEGEGTDAYASRVQEMIARKVGALGGRGALEGGQGRAAPLHAASQRAALACALPARPPRLLTRAHSHPLPSKQANLRVVPWDGYLKYYNLGEKHPGLIEKRRRVRGGAGPKRQRGARRGPWAPAPPGMSPSSWNAIRPRPALSLPVPHPTPPTPKGVCRRAAQVPAAQQRRRARDARRRVARREAAAARVARRLGRARGVAADVAAAGDVAGRQEGPVKRRRAMRRGAAC
jgi:hypothetical protein